MKREREIVALLVLPVGVTRLLLLCAFSSKCRGLVFMFTYLYLLSFVLVEDNDAARTVKNIRTSKGDYWIKH